MRKVDGKRSQELRQSSRAQASKEISIRRKLAILAERERRIERRCAVLESQYAALLRAIQSDGAFPKR
jgi:hypothetical protein